MKARISTPTDAARAMYALALRAIYSRRGFPWAVDDETIRIDPRVRHLVPHHTEPGVAAVIRDSVSAGSVVLDVGAFLGIYAILAARWAGPTGRVVAFEPTPWSGAMARRHFEFNGLQAPRVRLIEAAVSDVPGRAELHEYPQPYVNSLTPAPDASGAGTRRAVDVATIDEVCSRLGLRPSFIRMDVQGAEVHALRGARQTVRAAPDDLTIVVEVHPQCWPAFGMDESAMRATFRELGLDARPLDPGGPLVRRDGHVLLRKHRAIG